MEPSPATPKKMEPRSHGRQKCHAAAGASLLNNLADFVRDLGTRSEETLTWNWHMPAKSPRSDVPLAKASQGTSTPYDPLDLRTLAESMVKVVLEQTVHPLGEVPPFEGAGVYVIYYTGSYEPYRSIAQRNKGQKWDQPIYVGEAARKGGRKGGVLAIGPAGRVLLSRLKNHVDSRWLSA
jgi:hypothetical protein